MTEDQAFIEWKAEQYKHQSTEEEMEFVEHLHNFPRYFKKTFIDGYREAENEMRQKIIKIFENDEEEQGKIWKGCGLKLIGWDYENNRPDEQFNFYLNLVEEAEKKIKKV